MKDLAFKKTVIDADPAGYENDVLLVADFNGDGHEDFLVAGKFSRDAWGMRTEGMVAWYEYPDWKRHVIGRGCLEAGGVVADLTGNGLPDVVIGDCHVGKFLHWWRHPGPDGDPRQPWPVQPVTTAFERYHDQAFGDIDGDGRNELVVLSQNLRKLVYFKIPEDPTRPFWPMDHCHVIDEDVAIEGLRIADLDGDGQNELLAGHLLYKPGPDPRKPWQRRALLPELKWARTAVGDLNGNGHLDIVLSEAENPGARLLWLEGPDFTRVHSLGEDFFHLHSLEVADFTGDGTLDIFTAEMHLGRNPHPRLFIFRNDGRGHFTRQSFDNPCGTHESKLIHLGGSPLPSILIKPYLPHNRIELWENTGP